MKPDTKPLEDFLPTVNFKTSSSLEYQIEKLQEQDEVERQRTDSLRALVEDFKELIEYMDKEEIKLKKQNAIDKAILESDYHMISEME